MPRTSQQVQRLAPQFKDLVDAFEERRLELAATTAGAEPERVLVLEISGSVDDFVRAVRRIPRLEWLAELELEELSPEPDFFEPGHEVERLPGRLFLIMSSQGALQQLLSLWNRFRRHPSQPFPRRLGPWREVLRRLSRIRTWDERDRLEETGILNDWRDRIQRGEGSIPFEAELWFRSNPLIRQRAEAEFTDLIALVGGEVIRRVVLEEIRYHALLVRLPAARVVAVLEAPQAAWVRSDNVMYFAAIGQSVEVTFDETSGPAEASDRPEPTGPPEIAILDGLPIQNHLLLRNRLVVDDPNDWGAGYPVESRRHGTMIASAVLHGDLSAPTTAQTRPVYVRPILRPETVPVWVGAARESVPNDELAPDFTRRLVREMFEAGPHGPARSPEVRIINLSVGDPYRQFARSISPWAKAVDALAARYRVLFVVSGGNHAVPSLDIDGPWEAHSPQEIRRALVRALLRDTRNRRILAPSEAVNALTIGALHDDNSTISPDDPRVDPVSSGELPAPYSAHGLGYRRSIKPDVLAPGGRMLFHRPAGDGPIALTPAIATGRPPGVKAASPSEVAGDVSNTRFFSGTSVAAARVTGLGGRILSHLREVRPALGASVLPAELDAVTTKTLLVHGCGWGVGLTNTVRDLVEPANVREAVGRLAGYGPIQWNVALGNGASTRATLLRANYIEPETSHTYEIPAPPGLSGRAEWRALTITLSWLTPIRPMHRAYRAAALWFEPGRSPLGTARLNADWQAARRGTIQHEVLEGTRAKVFSDGEVISIIVSCRDETQSLADAIPYALAVTLAVAPTSEVAVHQEIRERLQVPVAASIGQP